MPKADDWRALVETRMDILYSLGIEVVDAGGIEQLPGIENREVIDFKSRTKR